jgi:hypothetical protein
MTFQGCFLPSFDSFGKTVSEKKIFEKSTNQKQKLPLAVMFVNGSELNLAIFIKKNFKGASYQVSIH